MAAAVFENSAACVYVENSMLVRRARQQHFGRADVLEAGWPELASSISRRLGFDRGDFELKL
jgi:hypothetical protein